MSTPKPGQIRCPTCLRSTPPAAFCTQCGSPIPPSARIRPRGMDRDELEDRLRMRRPGDPGFRRGSPVDDGPPGYVPFQPEPEDQLAAREADEAAQRHVDNTPPDFDAAAQPPPPRALPPEPPPEAYRPHMPAEPPPVEPAPVDEPPTPAPPPYVAPTPAPVPPASAASQPDYAEQAEPEYEPGYQEEEEAYPYAYSRRGDGGGRRGGGALPIIGFIALCALALAVGAVLAGVFAGPEVAQATPTPSIAASSPTPEPTPSQSTAASESGAASATPEPTDGPITFPDGAVLTVQPCATSKMSFDGCDKDGSVVGGDLWVWIGFDDARASDVFVLQLRSGNETLNEQEKELGQILECERGGEPVCSGYLIGAIYEDLDPGEYELVVRRNGDFADSATFRVEGSE